MDDISRFFLLFVKLFQPPLKAIFGIGQNSDLRAEPFRRAFQNTAHLTSEMRVFQT